MKRYCQFLPLSAALLWALCQLAAADELTGLKEVRRVVFLGDSITYSGEFIETIAQAKNAADLLERYPHGAEVLKLAQQRQRLLKDAWLTEVGHLRPGMNKALPLADAQQQVRDLTAKIGALVATPRESP